MRNWDYPVRIDFHPGATEELQESADWYFQRSPSAGRNFALAISRALEKIAADQQRFPHVDARHQACSLERFPFQLIFRTDGIRLIVVAVAHAKRRPGYWRSRATDHPNG